MNVPLTHSGWNQLLIKHGVKQWISPYPWVAEHPNRKERRQAAKLARKKGARGNTKK